MRSEKELRSSIYPFAVEFVGSDDICVRNLETSETVVRETRDTTALGSKEQHDRLTGLATRLANERRADFSNAPAGVTHETPAETAARLAG